MKSNKSNKDLFETARTQPPVMSFDEVKTLITQLPAGGSPDGTNPVANLAAMDKLLFSSNVFSALMIGLACYASLGASQTKFPEKTNQPQITSAANTEILIPSDSLQPPAVPKPAVVKSKGAQEKVSPKPRSSASIYSTQPGKVFKTIPAAPSAVTPAKPDRSVPGASPAVSVALPPIPFVKIDAATATDLGFGLSEKGIHYEMPVPNSKGKGNLIMAIDIVEGKHIIGIRDEESGLTGSAAGIVVYEAGNSKIGAINVNYPVFVSDIKGQQKVKYRFPYDNENKMDQAYFNQVANSLVPVLVKANNAYQDEALFWFPPTEKLIGVLPDSMQRQLKPLATAFTKSYTNLSGSAETISGTPTGASRQAATVTGYNKIIYPAQSENPALTAVHTLFIFPNPASGKVNVEVRFLEKATIKIYLADISGREVKVWQPLRPVTALATRYTFTLDGIAPGIYIVVMELATGEKYTQRLIVQ